jgi:hypothetical protein
MTVAALGGASLAQAQSIAAARAVTRAQLCVTEGELTASSDGSRLDVAVPKMRAYANQSATQGAQLRFTYLGPTVTQSALGSGATRVQFGLKLRAADPCNLVYVMWRVEPESKLVVSIKSNPDAHRSSQCGNRGYQNVKPTVSSAVPQLASGQAHTLRAALHGDDLSAYVDNRLVWQGPLGPVAGAMHGAAGVRSDNAHIEFELAVERSDSERADPGPGCRSGPEESE